MQRTDQSGDTLQADGYLPQRALQVAWRLFDRAEVGSGKGTVTHQWPEGRKAEAGLVERWPTLPKPNAG